MPGRPPHLLRSCSVSYICLLLGYLGLSIAPNVFFILGSIVVRSVGSSVLWIYSTLLLQLRVPNSLQGRIFALEMAFLTV